MIRTQRTHHNVVIPCRSGLRHDALRNGDVGFGDRDGDLRDKSHRGGDKNRHGDDDRGGDDRGGDRGGDGRRGDGIRDRANDGHDGGGDGRGGGPGNNADDVSSDRDDEGDVLVKIK